MTTIQVRIDDSIKAGAENAFRAMGFSMTDGIRSYLNYISMERKLPARCRPHKLSGDYADCRECHISPDQLLLYRMTDDELTIVRTGTHADLF